MRERSLPQHPPGCDLGGCLRERFPRGAGRGRAARLAAASEVAIDLESHSYRSYRGFVCGVVQYSCQLSVFFTYINAIVFYTHEAAQYAHSTGSDGQRWQTSNGIGILLVLLNSTCLFILIVFVRIIFLLGPMIILK